MGFIEKIADFLNIPLTQSGAATSGWELPCGRCGTTGAVRETIMFEHPTKVGWLLGRKRRVTVYRGLMSGGCGGRDPFCPHGRHKNVTDME